MSPRSYHEVVDGCITGSFIDLIYLISIVATDVSPQLQLSLNHPISSIHDYVGYIAAVSKQVSEYYKLHAPTTNAMATRNTFNKLARPYRSTLRGEVSWFICLGPGSWDSPFLDSSLQCKSRYRSKKLYHAYFTSKSELSTYAVWRFRKSMSKFTPLSFKRLKYFYTYWILKGSCRLVSYRIKCYYYSNIALLIVYINRYTVAFI